MDVDHHSFRLHVMSFMGASNETKLPIYVVPHKPLIAGRSTHHFIELKGRFAESKKYDLIPHILNLVARIQPL
jgi:hypothetical protein